MNLPPSKHTSKNMPENSKITLGQQSPEPSPNLIFLAIPASNLTLKVRKITLEDVAAMLFC